MAERKLILFDLLSEPEFIIQNEVFLEAESEEIECKSGLNSDIHPNQKYKSKSYHYA